MENPTLSQTGFDSNQVIVYKLGQIESELRAISDKLDTKERAQDIEIHDLQVDVSKLKQERTLVVGAAGAVSFLMGLATQVVAWPS